MKRLPLVLVVFVIVCICACLIASLQVNGAELTDIQDVAGFGNNGIPPGGSNCDNIGEFFPDNPFNGWPLQFHDCQNAAITYYYCDPIYIEHRGIDIGSYWSSPVWDAIAGATVIATANSRVRQADQSGGWNYGMGNFVQLAGFDPICEYDVDLDLNGDMIIGDYCGAICEEDINKDINNDGSIGEYCGEESKWYATYMHLLAITVSPCALGACTQIVRKGESIGYVDNSGNSDGAHLHYQINYLIDPTDLGKGSVAIDPGPALGCPDYQRKR